jgi:hypothetical protein
VHWLKLVWDETIEPKHAFIFWLAVRNRLCTGNVLCILQENLENREHLFFQCSFTARVWKQELEQCRQHSQAFDWDSYSLGVMGLTDEILSSIIGRIALATAHVWIQRNNRTHQGLPLSGEQLVKGHG